MPELIRLDSVSKCYRIFRDPKDRFKQAFLNSFQNILGRRSASKLYREHWALRDVSIELNRGEAIGILGRNGAGKSTLLQIIAGTVAPTSGTVKTCDRITALLELGSGFNPEFTGRENVYLNAQVMGMTHDQALARFDEIASFADIGDFIDQPVKTYSSGMIMRLAFALQTAMEPKVLIVDEALSVGDMFFQAKCMARINQLVDNGVTLLFVSHDIGTVRQLCSKALLIENGRLFSQGSAAHVSDQYLKIQLEDRNRLAQNRTSPPLAAQNVSVPAFNTHRDDEMMFGIEAFRKRAVNNRVGNGTAEIVNVQMLRDGKHAIEFDYDELVTIRIYASFKQRLTNVNHGLIIRTLHGSDVVYMDTRLQNQMDREYLAEQVYCFEWTAHLPLFHTQYSLSVGLTHPPKTPGQDWVVIDHVPHAYEFKIAPRAQGMINAFVALPSSLTISPI